MFNFLQINCNIQVPSKLLEIVDKRQLALGRRGKLVSAVSGDAADTSSTAAEQPESVAMVSESVAMVSKTVDVPAPSTLETPDVMDVDAQDTHSKSLLKETVNIEMEVSENVPSQNIIIPPVAEPTLTFVVSGKFDESSLNMSQDESASGQAEVNIEEAVPEMEIDNETAMETMTEVGLQDSEFDGRAVLEMLSSGALGLEEDQDDARCDEIPPQIQDHNYFSPISKGKASAKYPAKNSQALLVDEDEDDLDDVDDADLSDPDYVPDEDEVEQNKSKKSAKTKPTVKRTASGKKKVHFQSKPKSKTAHLKQISHKLNVANVNRERDHLFFHSQVRSLKPTDHIVVKTCTLGITLRNQDAQDSISEAFVKRNTISQVLHRQTDIIPANLDFRRTLEYWKSEGTVGEHDLVKVTAVFEAINVCKELGIRHQELWVSGCAQNGIVFKKSVF